MQVGLELVQDARSSVAGGRQQLLHRGGAGEAAHRSLASPSSRMMVLMPFALRTQVLHRCVALTGPGDQGGGLRSGDGGPLGELRGNRHDTEIDTEIDTGLDTGLDSRAGLGGLEVGSNSQDLWVKIF